MPEPAATWQPRVKHTDLARVPGGHVYQTAQVRPMRNA